MFLHRFYRRPRWIVGCTVVSTAVITMLLAHSLGVVHLFLSGNVNETRRSKDETIRFKDTNGPSGYEGISYPSFSSSETSRSPLPTPSIFTYVEEPPTGNELKRLMKTLSTQGAVCADVRRIGGSPPHGASCPLGPDGMWYVCFDEEVELNPGWCVVYSFGINNDFSFDEKMAEYGCTVSAFDPTMGKEDHNHSAGVMFYNLGLSDVNQEEAKNRLSADQQNKKTWKTRTLAAIIQELEHTQREIDILKMDIESDEWKCLRHMLAEGTLRKYVRQLNVEYHLAIRTPQSLRLQYSIAKWLERQGFRIFHTRRNRFCQSCWEMSYINSNLVKLTLN